MKLVYEPPPDVQKEIAARLAKAPGDRLNQVRDSRSDAALRFAVSEATNPEDAYACLVRMRDATELITRLRMEVGVECSSEWLGTLQALLFTKQITEVGVRRVLEQLKLPLKGD